MLTIYFLLLVTAYGACVGSFLNVVAYRLPLGRSLVRPGSRCPHCDTPIRWYDNLPVASWILLRGKCRQCGARISVRYPIVEALTAALFGGLFYIQYMSGLWPALAEQGVGGTWPVLVVQLTLVGCLVAATLIDAEHFVIPLPIPWLATLVALVVLPGAAALGWMREPVMAEAYLPLARLLEDLGQGAMIDPQPLLPMSGPGGLGAAIGGAAGLIVALGLLHLKVIPRSFDEPVDETKTVAEDVLSYEHPRREVLKELLFVVWPLVGLIVGGYVGAGRGELGLAWRVLGGVGLGYFAGAGLVWSVRILGTLVFGKEAMGLGDAHLWGAVGAVIGWLDATVAFFIAPFFGLLVVVVSAGVAAIAKGKVRVVPYGPFLAAAAVVMLAFRRPIMAFLGIL